MDPPAATRAPVVPSTGFRGTARASWRLRDSSGEGATSSRGDDLEEGPATPSSEGATDPRARTRARPLQTFTPAYPAALRDLGIEGTVVVEVEVDERGRTARARVIESVHPALDRLSLLAVRRMRWTPGTVGGAPVTDRVRYRFRWTLTR